MCKVHVCKSEALSLGPPRLYNKIDMVELPLIPVLADRDRISQRTHRSDQLDGLSLSLVINTISEVRWRVTQEDSWFFQSKYL